MIGTSAAIGGSGAASLSRMMPTGSEPPVVEITLPEPASAEVDPVRTLVPRIAAVSAVLTSDTDRQQAIAIGLAEESTVLALEDGPGTLCAIVPVAAPVVAEGRWERNGEPISSTGAQQRDPPGYGECLPNDDGEPFRDGVYQYLAVGSTGATSAAATIVIGHPAVVVWLLNNGDEPICLVHLSPEPADYYEAISTDGPLQPGEAVEVSVADVDHDVRVFGCPPDDVVGTTQLSPEPGSYTDLTDDPQAPDTPAPTTSAAPSTTPDAATSVAGSPATSPS